MRRLADMRLESGVRLCVGFWLVVLSGCKDDPIPEGVPTGALVVQLQVDFDPEFDFDAISLGIDQVDVVHRLDPYDPETEHIYTVNYELSEVTFDHETMLNVIGQYEVPAGEVMQVRYRVVSSSITVDGQELELKTPSAAHSGIKFVPADDADPFIIEENGIFAVEGRFVASERLVLTGHGRHQLKPTIPSTFFSLNNGGVRRNELIVVAVPGTAFEVAEAEIAAHGSTLLTPIYFDRYRIRVAPETLIQDAVAYFEGRPWVGLVAGSFEMSSSEIRPAGETISAPQETAAFPDGWQRVVDDMGEVGSFAPVVAVIDTGVDIANQDIAPNLWINPGEIAQLGLIDADGDGVLTIGDIDDPLNAAISPGDTNGNGYLDGEDLLLDPLFTDGVDQDGNCFEDDLFGWDFANNDSDPRGTHNHGTGVAGAVGGANNGVDVLGASHRVRIVALRVFPDGGGASNEIVDAAMQYAQNFGLDGDPINDIDIANMSLGRTFRHPDSSETCENDCVTLQKAQEYDELVPRRILELDFLANPPTAVAMPGTGVCAFTPMGVPNTLWVVAASNDNADMASPQIFGGTVEAMVAVQPNRVIGVASVDQALVTSDFSNTGLGIVGIAAPGEDWELADIGNGTRPGSGTSFASPAVAGSLALLLSLDPTLEGDAEQLRTSFLDAAPSSANADDVDGGRFLNLDTILESLGY